MKSKYDWLRYNDQRNKEAINILKFNQKNQINFFEKGLYNHVRDLYAFSIILASQPNLKAVTKILDYGGNLISNSNLLNKIEIKKKIFIYNPFIKKKLSLSKSNIEIINKPNNIKTIDLTYFGSVLQYFENLENLNGKLVFLKSKYILITHTPITLIYKDFTVKQKNAKNLYQKIHSIKDISNTLLKNKFQIIFKSVNDFKYSGINKRPKETYLLNLLYKKK